MSHKRYLTKREAERCEQALEPACKCRCGGAKHGAKRIPAGGDYSTLPIDDPHHRPPLTKKEALRLLRHCRDHVIFGRLGRFGFDGRGDWDHSVWRTLLDTFEGAEKEIKVGERGGKGEWIGRERGTGEKS